MADIVFSDETLAVDGVPLRCCASGNGSAIVVLPGAGGLRLTRLHELLAQTHRVIALGIPGFGDVPTEPSLAVASDFAALFNRAAGALGLERYHLLAHGLGAGIALSMALARPEPVENIVLLAPMAIQPQRPADALPHDLAERLRCEFAGSGFESALKALRVPVLSLFGTLDTISPPARARLYRTGLPVGYIAMVYDAGHRLEAERPEAIKSLTADFLERGERFIVSKSTGLINP
jgi:pimeloyl-ACP methyl ester carboxylesterase